MKTAILSGFVLLIFGCTMPGNDDAEPRGPTEISIPTDIGVLEPEFQEDFTEYMVNVDSDVALIALTVTTSDPDAVVTYSSGSNQVPVTQGKNEITVTITDPDGSKTSYRIVVNVAYSDYAIGDIGPAGGYIVYDDTEPGAVDLVDARFIEVAPAGWDIEDLDGDGSTGDDPALYWGGYGDFCFEIETDGVLTYAALGMGESNTESLVGMVHVPYDCADPGPTDHPAAKAAWNAEVVTDSFTYRDWYLPSEDELHCVFQTLLDISEETYGMYADYWSSTESYYLGESYISGMWKAETKKLVPNGDDIAIQTNRADKNTLHPVRPVRSF